jgi:acetyltransferase-like isoleucine patch superfamily enzyme
MLNEPIIQASGIKNVRFGENVKLVQPLNLYGCTIGKDCFVGPFTEIQANVVVGERTRIQSHSFICEGVTIGSDCFIGHGVMFINDRFKDAGPACGDKSKWEKTMIGNNVSIGSNATILPVTICNGVVIGAGSVVTKDILERGVYVGNPARLKTSPPLASTLNPHPSTK